MTLAILLTTANPGSPYEYHEHWKDEDKPTWTTRTQRAALGRRDAKEYGLTTSIVINAARKSVSKFWGDADVEHELEHALAITQALSYNNDSDTPFKWDDSDSDSIETPYVSPPVWNLTAEHVCSNFLDDRYSRHKRENMQAAGAGATFDGFLSKFSANLLTSPMAG